MEGNFNNVGSLDSANFITNLKLIDAIDCLDNYINLFHDVEFNINRKENLNTISGKSEYYIANIRYTLFLLSGLLLAYYKEDIIDPNTRDVLINKYTYYLIDSCFKNKEGRYVIGDIEFSSGIEVITVLRNCLLHGNYVINGNDIIISYDGKKGTINFRDLCGYSVTLSEYRNCKDKHFSCSYVLADFVETLYKKFTNFCEIRLDVTVKGNRSINHEIISYLKTEMSHIKFNNLANSKHYNAALMLKDLQQNFDNKFNSATLTISTLQIDDKLIENAFDVADSYNKVKNNTMFPYVVGSLIEDSLGSDYIYSSLVELMRLVGNALDLPKATYPTNYNKVELALSLIKFYTYFNYGLDNLLSDSSGVNILDIFEGKKFDFSKMDLSKFDDPNMAIERNITIPDLNESLDYIKIQYNDYQKAKETYNNYINNDTKEHKEEIINKLYNLMNEKEQIYIKAVQNVDSINKFDVDKFNRNLNIINHIRNSIAHGNYYFELNNLANNDGNYIVFNDIYNGVTTYSCCIALNDFNELFMYKDEVKEVLYNNLKVSTNTFDLSVLAESSAITNDKRAEWKHYIHDNKDKINKLKVINYYISSLNNEIHLIEREDNSKSITYYFSKLLLNCFDENCEVYEVEGYIFTEDDYFDIIYQVLYFGNIYLDQEYNLSDIEIMFPNKRFIQIIENISFRKRVRDKRNLFMIKKV